MKVASVFELGDINGVESFSGTSLTQALEENERDITDFNDEFFFGQIANIGNTDARITLVLAGDSTNLVTHQLRRKEVLTIKGMPIRKLRVLTDSTVTLKSVAVIIKAETPAELIALLHEAKMEETFNDLNAAAGLTFPDYEHTDIAAAATTTIATPAANLVLRVYKITVAVETPARVELIWFDDDGTSNPNQIGRLNFGGEGLFVYDFGDRGLLCPNGVDGLLRAVTNNAAIVDIDVISEDVQA